MTYTFAYLHNWIKWIVKYYLKSQIIPIQIKTKSQSKYKSKSKNIKNINTRWGRRVLLLTTSLQWRSQTWGARFWTNDRRCVGDPLCHRVAKKLPIHHCVGCREGEGGAKSRASRHWRAVDPPDMARSEAAATAWRGEKEPVVGRGSGATTAATCRRAGRRCPLAGEKDVVVAARWGRPLPSSPVGIVATAAVALRERKRESALGDREREREILGLGLRLQVFI
jgi:hypothetical protein